MHPVAGKSLAAVPAERSLPRHPDISLRVVYGVAADVGDDLTATVVSWAGAGLDPDGFAAVRLGRPDLSPNA